MLIGFAGSAAALALGAALGINTANGIFGIYHNTADELADLLHRDDVSPALVGIVRAGRPLYEPLKAVSPSCTEVSLAREHSRTTLIPSYFSSLPQALFPEFNDELDMNDCLLIRRRFFWREGRPPLHIAQTMRADTMWEQSTGSTVWGGGVALQRHLQQLGPSYFEGKRVLDLGTGTGLAAITAADLGAQVVATDRDDAVLQLATRNARENLDADALSRFSTLQLTWGKPLPPGMDSNLDLVIGADLTYNKESWPDLVTTLQSVGSPVLLSASERRTAELDELQAYLRERGARFEPLNSPLERGYGRDKVRIISIEAFERPDPIATKSKSTSPSAERARTYPATRGAVLPVLIKGQLN